MMSPGIRLGPYEVLAPLGAGGMGEVWRARDHRLHRDVAIKVLPEATHHDEKALARFESEARAVAALSHPNILSIHDFGNENGTLYAVMELLEGATLRERLHSVLPVSRTLDWALQIAQGLAAAHERGIVHRDLKPENVFVTRDDVVKILDFGLARQESAPAGRGPDEATLIVRTAPGAIVGTIGYASPEQLQGEPADARSDIFSFGVVLFEMLAGEPAFLRSTAVDTMVAILREEPRTLSNVAPEIDDILRHCLEKNRDDRFRSARDLVFALRLAMRSGSGSTTEVAFRRTPRPTDSGARPTEISIAVLPFRNISPSPEAEYFSDGMTEEVINTISNIPALHVAARTSSFAFKGREEDVRRIGRELGVAMVLEGSIRQIGTRLRVSAQLVNVESGYQVWSERWDRELADVFAVQDEIAQAIAATFKLRVASGGSAAETRKPQNIEAYDRYLKGRYLLTRRRAMEAIVELEAAIESDPLFGDPYTALSDAWAVLGFYGGVSTWEAWARARSWLDEAERLVPDAAGIPLSRAIIEHYYGWNSAREEAFCREAIDREPKSAEGWNWLALCCMAASPGEALQHAARGIELEPYHPNVRTSSAWASIYAGDYETAERTVAKAIEIAPDAAFALWTHGITLRCLGQHDRAVAIFEQLVERSGRRLPFYVAQLGGAYAAAGERAKAEEIIQELHTRRESGKFVASLDLATPLACLGDFDAAAEALERAREERNALLWSRIYFPEHIPLRTHPRWIALAQRLGRAAPVGIV